MGDESLIWKSILQPEKLFYAGAIKRRDKQNLAILTPGWPKEKFKPERSSEAII